MAKLKFKNKETGQYEEVSLIQGPKGDPGEVIQQSYIGPEKPTDENISVWIDNNATYLSQVYVSNEVPVDDSIEVWIDTNGNPDGDTSIVPTKMSQLKNDIVLRKDNIIIEENSWLEDSIFEDYPYKVEIPFENVTKNDWLCTLFTPDHTNKDLKNFFSPYVYVDDNKVILFGKNKTNANIENIIVQKVVI